MRRHRVDHEKLEVCREYERLRKRWQRLVDGTTAPSGIQPVGEDAATSAQQKMVGDRHVETDHKQRERDTRASQAIVSCRSKTCVVDMVREVQ